MGLEERPVEGPWASDEPLSGVLGAQAAGRAPTSRRDLPWHCQLWPGL